MPPSCPPIHVEQLRSMEQSYQQCLRDNPDDLSARIGLAWCLFLQALYQAGRESAEADGTAPSVDRREPTDLPVAADLLGESVRNAETVRRISPHPHDQQRVNSLYALIALVGGESAILDAHRVAECVFLDIARDVQDDDTPDTVETAG